VTILQRKIKTIHIALFTLKISSSTSLIFAGLIFALFSQEVQISKIIKKESLSTSNEYLSNLKPNLAVLVDVKCLNYVNVSIFK